MNSDFIIGGRGQSAILAASSGSGWTARGGGMETAGAVTVTEDETETAAQDSASAKSTTVKSAAVKSAADPRAHLYAEKSHTRGPEVMTNSDMSFDDFIDIVNPLQHIPLVNMAYRAITGDTISGVAQIAGSALYGGIAGVFSGVANAIVQEETGKDIGGTVVAMLSGEDARRAPAAPDADMPAGETLLADAGDSSAADGDAGEDLSGEMLVADAATPASEGALSQEEADRILDAAAGAAASPSPAAPAPAPRETVENRTLLADAASQIKNTTLQTSPAQSAAATPARAPFGGVMDSGISQAAARGAPSIADKDAASELAAASTASPAASHTASLATAAPLRDTHGNKAFSLEGVARAAARNDRMPLGNAPDVRLKSTMQQVSSARKPSAGHSISPGSDAALPETVPLVSKEKANTILGLDKTAHPPVAEGSSPATPPNGRPSLPPQLIQDMMMKGIEKYQEGISSGSFTRPSIDIQG